MWLLILERRLLRKETDTTLRNEENGDAVGETATAADVVAAVGVEGNDDISSKDA